MSARQRFETRVIRLVGQVQVDTVKAVAENAPRDPDNPVEVVFREVIKKRGLDQNGLYWKRLTEIAEQAWLQGRQYSKETWHHYVGKHLMPETVVTKDGEERSKWIESPDGDAVVISTTLLERRFFSQYITIVEAFGASELGVEFSANPNEAGTQWR